MPRRRRRCSTDRDAGGASRRASGKLPEVERIVLLPDAGEQQLAQGLISMPSTSSTGLQVATFPTVFAGNPNITTFTGKNCPGATSTGGRPRSTSTASARPSTIPSSAGRSAT